MVIKVALHGRLRDLTNKDEIIFDEDKVTLRELILQIMKLLGNKSHELGLNKPEDILSPRVRIIIMINGISIKLIGNLEETVTSTDITSMDHIDVLEGIGGG